MFDSAIQETYLCVIEQRFVERASLSDNISRCLALQWIQQMEMRLSAEKAKAIQRVRQRDPGDAVIKRIKATWHSLSRELRSLRLLPASTSSPVLQRWERYLFDFIEGRDVPPIPRLCELLSPLFTLDDWPDYQKLVAFVRSSLHYLHSVKSPPCFGRIDSRGPGSPQFSPPYTFLSSPLGNNVEDFCAQVRSIEVLHLCDSTSMVQAYEILSSFDTSALTLTTLIHYNLAFTSREALILRSFLKKHCIAFSWFERCEFYDLGGDFSFPLKIRDTIYHNRRKWRKDAYKQGQLRHQIGLEESSFVIRNLDKNQPSVVPIGNDLALQPHVGVTAMIYIPDHGTLLPTLTARTLGPANLHFAARLTHLPFLSSNLEDEVCRTEKCITSLEWGTMKFNCFPQVAPGCYEVHISTWNDYAYVFRSLLIDFIPGSCDEQEKRISGQAHVEVGSSRLFENHDSFGFSHIVAGFETLLTYTLDFGLDGPEGYARWAFTFLNTNPFKNIDQLTLTLSGPNREIRASARWSGTRRHAGPYSSDHSRSNSPQPNSNTDCEPPLDSAPVRSELLEMGVRPIPSSRYRVEYRLKGSKRCQEAAFTLDGGGSLSQKLDNFTLSLEPSTQDTLSSCEYTFTEVGIHKEHEGRAPASLAIRVGKCILLKTKILSSSQTQRRRREKRP
ncbi:hypothetical protein PM082_011560 [Marasmius tenuissimus]|nr:hypothetical protein PM082_011560 [Marasmius tenuissimus]